jgi:hypothetical protein
MDKKIIILFILLIGIILNSCGCGTYRGVLRALPPAMTKDDVVALSGSGTSEDVIIQKINATYTVFYLSVDDIVQLKNQGVSTKVIDFMRETEIRAREMAASSAERRRCEEDYRAYRWDMRYSHSRDW